MPSLDQSQGHYRYDPNVLRAQGPARIFPHNGIDGVMRYIASRLGQNMVDQGQLSAPWILLLENLKTLSKSAEEAWIKFSTLFVDLEIFQSDWFNLTLPPGEQFNASFVKLRRDMGKALNAANDAAKAAPGQEKRDRFYQALQANGRDRPKIMGIHERDRGLSDAEFARQRLAGPNPITLYRVQDKSVLSGIAHPTVDLTEVAAQDRLFAIDYPLLNLTPAELQTGRYVGSPKAFFYRREQGLEPLEPVCIQLEAGGKTFTPTDGDDWTRAKLYVQVADVTQHELITHLCYTHLVMEAIAIATPRRLPQNHPVYRLLRPHLKFLLAINTRGNAILLSEGAAIDKLMAPTRAVSLSLINQAFRNKPFSDYAFARDIQRRGVTSDFLAEFPYRDDAELLWRAIYKYASAYLHQYYASDTAIVTDFYLQEWAAELGAPLNTRSHNEFAQAPPWIPSAIAQQVGLALEELPDFPRLPDFPNTHHPGHILSLQELIDVATIVIFTCSVQHAAVNFSQFDYFGYVPNSPFAAYTRPDVASAVSDLLPTPEQEIGQMELAFALSGIRWSQLGSSEIIKFAALGDRQVLKNFQADLETIESEIKNRNHKRQTEFGIDYPYLLPSLIPNSINI